MAINDFTEAVLDRIMDFIGQIKWWRYEFVKLLIIEMIQASYLRTDHLCVWDQYSGTLRFMDDLCY